MRQPSSRRGAAGSGLAVLIGIAGPALPPLGRSSEVPLGRAGTVGGGGSSPGLRD